LIHAGVAPGDRIAMLAAPGVQFLSSFLATSAIGGIWVGLNPRYTPHELDRLVQTVTPRLVFADVSIAGAEVADWMRRTSPAITVIALGDRSVSPYLALGGLLMLMGVVLHLAESHGHEHVHEAVEHEHAHSHDDGHHEHVHQPMPSGLRSHRHAHAPVTHSHAHVPDLHHGHRH
jgi:acyl-coenzyme A synthetase/AMP-(fatty) acid ligase